MIALYDRLTGYASTGSVPLLARHLLNRVICIGWVSVPEVVHGGGAELVECYGWVSYPGLLKILPQSGVVSSTDYLQQQTP